MRPKRPCIWLHVLISATIYLHLLSNRFASDKLQRQPLQRPLHAVKQEAQRALKTYCSILVKGNASRSIAAASSSSGRAAGRQILHASCAQTPWHAPGAKPPLAQSAKPPPGTKPQGHGTKRDGPAIPWREAPWAWREAPQCRREALALFSKQEHTPQKISNPGSASRALEVAPYPGQGSTGLW